MQYTIKKSSSKFKKYIAVFADGKIIHFGDNMYQQFRYSTSLRLYKHLDHGDEKRKKAYYARHGAAVKYSAK